MLNAKDLIYPCPFCGSIPDSPHIGTQVVCKTKGCAMRGKVVKMDKWNKQHCRQINPAQRIAPEEGVNQACGSKHINP